MRFKKSSYAVAVLALMGSLPAHTLAQSLPAPTSGTLEAWFKAPLGGQTVSGTLSLDKCYLKGYSISRVSFFLDNTALNSDTNVSDGMSCELDTTKFSNGSHLLRAVAYDSQGRSYTERVTINIQNAANTPPTVSITSPSANQSITGTTLSYAANATDNAGISRVEFRLDGNALPSDTSAPYGGSVAAPAPGTHTLTATAFDAAGLSSTNSVTFTVPQPNTAPTVSITSPTANQSVTGTTLSYAANATDNAGVSRVEFRLDGSALPSDTSAPYGGSVAAPAPGTHTLTATAFDAAGLSSASSVTFTVPQPTTTPTTTLPAPTSGTLEAWFKAPLSGNTVSGKLALDKCYVKGTGVSRVSFFLDDTALNADTNVGDGMSCELDTTKFANGSHMLRAVAYDSSGRSYNERITINIQNSATTPPPSGGGSDPAPTVSITSPTANQTLSGNSLTFAANASDNTGVSRVEFRVDGTLVATDTTNSYGGTANNLAAGTHTLTATAYDTTGQSASSSVTFKVPTSDSTPPPTSSLPSTGVKATPTFHSIGLYWTSPSGAGSSGCNVQYKAAGESAWKQGHAMWYDARNRECRGSLVHLNPGTDYEIQMGVAGQQMSRGIVAKTWSEAFPIARTVHVQPGTTLNITQGGTKDGYVLYTPAPGTSGVLDAKNGQDHNVRISAPYVIVRGFTMRGATMDAVAMYAGARDVVIENNNISGWGRSRGGSLGVDGDSAVKARCSSTFQLERTIVQNNTIHNPRYGSNSWSSGHPAGPQAITYWSCGANHVFRYNKVTSTSGHYYNDIFGGGSNFSAVGFPFADTDIYGNHLANAYDDGIEAEGGNRNVRIWGNYIDDTFIGIASTATHVGPLYVFRNVTGKTGTFGKSGQKNGYGEGRRYFFHNTILQVSGGASSGIKGNTNEPLTNSISRNNVWHMQSSNGMAIGMIGGTANNFDYDMSNGNMRPYSGAQPNGIAATPSYASGHGPASGAGGFYQLSPSSRGYDAGAVLPNFNDGFTGSRPDMGAHEAGAGQMKFGPR
jgi:hypothetical protein